MKFSDLGLITPLLDAVAKSGYETPTEIQAATIKTVLAGADMMASAQTGTGKTAAFTLPLLQQLSERERPSKAPRALVLTPTRELAAQIQDSVRRYGANLELSSLVVFGGVKIGPQISKLRQGVDILVATPGRLLDLHQQGAVKLNQIEILVLDEADRMLDMGFIHDMKRIQALLPAKKQTLLFSATFSGEIRQLANTFLHKPVEVDVAPRNATATNVTQHLHPVDKKNKTALLTQLFQENSWGQSLIFTRTKHGANKLARDLNKKGIKAEAIHGNKSQGARTRALNDFKHGKVSTLVATDIASRGLDINELPVVINYELPHVAEDYVHRIGRTGRAGANGIAFSLVSADEAKQLHAIEKLISKNIERQEIEGFEPDHAVPERKAGQHRPSNNRGQKPRNNRNSKPQSSGNQKRRPNRRARAA